MNKPKTRGGDPTSPASLLDRIATAASEAKTVLSELHAATKEARQVHREVKRDTAEWVSNQITEATRDGLAKLSASYDKAKTESFERIMASFEEIKDTLMGLAEARDAFRRGDTDHKTMLEMCGELVDELVAARCPACNRPGQPMCITNPEVLDATPGSITICFYCGAFNVWVNRYRYRPATTTEMEAAMANEQVRKLMQDYPNGAAEKVGAGDMVIAMHVTAELPAPALTPIGDGHVLYTEHNPEETK